MRRITAWIAIPIAALAAYLVVQSIAIPATQLQPRGGSIAFTDRSGISLGTVLSPDENHDVAVDLAHVSPRFLQAIVAAEDARFYQHGAVDPLAAGRAIASTVRCACVTSGASTIDMQLARIAFALPNTLRGKLAQVWDAFRIEMGSDKPAILSAYVNRVAMGGNVYGVEAAARAYFGVPASDLDVAQAALLAGIPNDPVRLDPRAHWGAARARQRYVLARMVATGAISATQRDAALHEELHVRSRDEGVHAAEHLLFALARERPDAASPLRTTIDATLQRFVESQARQVVGALADHNVTQAAALVIDNRTGDVLAYVGSADYFSDAFLGRNDGVQAPRQPGSTLKPFLYDYALERRAIRPTTVLADVPTSYAIPGGELYSPEDYDRRFSGPVLPRIALANSLNVPAVRVLSRVGVPAFLDRLHALGFTQLQRTPEYYGLGLTLGAGEVTLWDLAHAYVTMARAGSAIPLRVVADDLESAPQQLGDPATWELVTDMLADRYARAQAFGLGSVVDMPFPAAVKTGTSSGSRDTWTVGFTREYTVATWVGNFTGAPMQRISGVSGAGPLWNRIMLHLYDHRDPPPFPAPAGYERTRLCATTGSTNLAGCEQVLAEYLDHGDLARSGAATRTSGSAFDEWQIVQGVTHATRLRVLFPHDGDLFEDELAPNDPHRDQQRIEFVAAHPHGATITWTLNGRTLQSTAPDRYYWIVEPGTWLLTAHDGTARRTVRFTVERAHPHGVRGFTVVSR